MTDTTQITDTMTPAPVQAPAKVKTPRKRPASKKQAKVDAKPGKNPRSIVPLRFKEQYAKHNDTNGDKIALTLKAATTTENKDGRPCLDVDALMAIAKVNKVDTTKYAKLNNGQLRMNLGNKLRGMLKHGNPVVIGKQTFANAEKALAKPVAEAVVAEAVVAA